MDPKMIEMNNLRVLNDYLNQTIDALSRQPRLGQPAHLGFSPFAAPFAQIPATAGLGTDTVYNPWFGSSMYGHTPFGVSPFTPYSAAYGQVNPFIAQPGIPATTFGSWQQPWGQVSEVTKTAQLCQALCARQQVLEAACRACGIPV